MEGVGHPMRMKKCEKCHYEGTGTFEGLCIGTRELDSCIGYDVCVAFKPKQQTNADRIRAMSDEELAKVLGCPRLDDLGYQKCFSIGCKECILVWLKQPVKDGEGE